MTRGPRAAPELLIEVSVPSPEWNQVAGAADLCREAALATLRHLGVNGRAAELSIVLADDATVRDLNRRYRQQDKPTNVLSFPGQPEGLAACRGGAEVPPVIVGDVILASGTVLAEAAAQEKPAGDHVRHLVVHGVLHLLGFDHETDDEAERMESIEKTVLAGLGVPDPYLSEAAPARV